MTALTAVIGWPIAHSKSPALLDAAFAAVGIDARMIAIAVAPERLADAIADLRARRMLGASVTLPHKQAVLALCDELAGPAREIGAVNCVALRGGKLAGYNTDTGGFRDALEGAGFVPAGTRCVVLGAGGAARAVAYALADARELVVIARTPAQVGWISARPWRDAELRDAFAHADLVVDCTPAGLDAETDGALADALPIDALAAAARVATLVYHRPTRLLERARARGHATLDGRAMLVHQAARAFALWTGKPPPIDIMTRALDDALVKIG